MTAQEKLERVYNVSEAPRLTLSNIRGSVEIQTGDDASISVTAIKHLDSGDAKHTEIQISQETENSVSVRTHNRPSSWLSFSRKLPCKVDYLVRVPRKCSLYVSGVSNTATIQGVKSDSSIETVSGALTLNDLSGNLNIKSVSGDIDGEELSGSLKLKTVSGDANICESNFHEIRGTTVSGHLVIQTPFTGHYHFNSISGDVHLVVPSNTHCSVNVSSMSGEFTTSLPRRNGQRRNGKGSFEIGDGGVSIDFDSVSGDLFLTTMEGDTEASPPDPDSQASRRDVLDRIAQGELTVEEGIRELQA